MAARFMAHQVVRGTRSGAQRFALRVRLGRLSRRQPRLAVRLERYCGPMCAACGEVRAQLAVVSAAGGVWHLCQECSERAGCR